MVNHSCTHAAFLFPFLLFAFCTCSASWPLSLSQASLAEKNKKQTKGRNEKKNLAFI
jgi:hypothetical protein